jgi:hypothetical protein
MFAKYILYPKYIRSAYNSKEENSKFKLGKELE